MSEGPIKPPQTLWDNVKALYAIFGWKTPAVTVVGSQFSILVATIPFISRQSIHWLEETTLAMFFGVLTLVGVSSLRERWLSLGPLEGFQVRPSRPRPFLRWLGSAGLTVLGGVLVIGWFLDPPPDPRLYWITPLLGFCCLIGALVMARLACMAPRHVLVREGLAFRQRGGWSLIPWERIAHLGVADYYENMVATVTLSHLLTPLPTVWRAEKSPEQQQLWAERQLRAFEQTRRWFGADLQIWGWSCKMSPGLFAFQARQALLNPTARQHLPSFEEATDMGPIPATPTWEG